jgi:histone-lysine N-methyltransferase SETD1
MLNRRFHLVLKESAIQGQGCYAGEPIPREAFIVEYAGELIPAAEAYRREQDTRRTGIYTFWTGEDWAIDGYAHGNIARFINHSCTPNCDYRIEGQRVSIHAARDIAEGEELTIDYSYSPEGEEIPCCCGSPGCRGRINACAEDDPGTIDS